MEAASLGVRRAKGRGRFNNAKRCLRPFARFVRLDNAEGISIDIDVTTAAVR